MTVPATHFAPAQRAHPSVVKLTRETFLTNRIAVTLLEGIPDLAIILNRERQVIAMNRRLIETLGVTDPEALIGMRPGEAAGCIHATDGPGGCGTGEHCVYCGAVNAIMDCLDSRQAATRECRIQTSGDSDGGALDLEVVATFLNIDDMELVLVALRDISAEKRRHVLEQVFFHDVLNTAGSIEAVTQLMEEPEQDPAAYAEYTQSLRRLAQQIIEEITAQRQLLAAEQRELRPRVTRVAIPEILHAVADFYRYHNLARHLTLELAPAPEVVLHLDAMLLRRVLGNLLKNALEATEPGGVVTLAAEERDGSLTIAIRNPGVIPEEIQRQIFKRSFSTKGGVGRGIGTYSVKLFTERYLNGQVEFTSRDPEGTTFRVILPIPA